TRLDLAFDVDFKLSNYQFINVGNAREKSTVEFRNSGTSNHGINSYEKLLERTPMADTIIKYPERRVFFFKIMVPIRPTIESPNWINPK
ncbi:hypothetical protein, partial [Serratia marcescens]|uniref:hypothetical protein n=1 Tax=Serratia marcescens TaxID=615 RepID=UPI0013C340E8